MEWAAFRLALPLVWGTAYHPSLDTGHMDVCRIGGGPALPQHLTLVLPSPPPACRSAAGTSSQGMMRRSEGMRAPLQGISGGNSLPLDGSFRPIVDLTEPLKGDEDNPVYKWHNDFIATRQHGRAQLQAALYERATGRYKARTDLTSAAGMATTLFGQLNLSHGRMLGANNPHGKVVSPYKRLEAFQAQQVGACRWYAGMP